MNLRVIGDGGINWNWYLAGDFNEEEKTVHIYYHERWHKYEHRGSSHPANAEWRVRMKLMEDKDRVVYGVKLDGVEYLVLNPQHVFSYRDMSVYRGE